MRLFEHDLYSIVCTSSLQFPVSRTSFKSISTNVGYANTKTMVGIQNTHCAARVWVFSELRTVNR